jgi:hypothetical protein
VQERHANKNISTVNLDFGLSEMVEIKFRSFQYFHKIFYFFIDKIVLYK